MKHQFSPGRLKVVRDLIEQAMPKKTIGSSELMPAQSAWQADMKFKCRRFPTVHKNSAKRFLAEVWKMCEVFRQRLGEDGGAAATDRPGEYCLLKSERIYGTLRTLRYCAPHCGHEQASSVAVTCERHDKQIGAGTASVRSTGLVHLA
jgi:hypothetical protein